MLIDKSMVKSLVIKTIMSEEIQLALAHMGARNISMV